MRLVGGRAREFSSRDEVFEIELETMSRELRIDRERRWGLLEGLGGLGRWWRGEEV